MKRFRDSETALQQGAKIIMDDLENAGVNTFGNVYWVDPTNGNDDNNGQTKDSAFATITKAEATVVSGNHDIVFLSANAAHAQTKMLTLTKSRVHWVGLGGRGGSLGLGARTRITMGDSTVAADIAVMQNTGVGRTFTGIKFDSSSTVAASLFGIAEGGEYTIYKGCEFYKSSDLDETTAAEVLNNGDSTQWIDCYFGSTAIIIADNKIRPCMSLTATLSGKTCRDNFMSGCVMGRKAGGTEATFIYGTNATDVERMFVIENTKFINNPLSAATPAVAVSFGAAQTEGAVTLDNRCLVTDVSVMATTGQNIFVDPPDGATYALAGLGQAS